MIAERARSNRAKKPLCKSRRFGKTLGKNNILKYNKGYYFNKYNLIY